MPDRKRACTQAPDGSAGARADELPRSEMDKEQG